MLNVIIRIISVIAGLLPLIIKAQDGIIKAGLGQMNKKMFYKAVAIEDRRSPIF